MRKPGPIPPPQLLTPSRAPHSTKQLPAWGHHSGHAGCGFLASSGRWTPPLPQPGSDVHDQRKCLLLEFMFHIPHGCCHHCVVQSPMGRGEAEHQNCSAPYLRYQLPPGALVTRVIVLPWPRPPQLFHQHPTCCHSSRQVWMPPSYLDADSRMRESQGQDPRETPCCPKVFLNCSTTSLFPRPCSAASSPRCS